MGADLNNIVKCQKLTDDHVQFLIYQILRGLKVYSSFSIPRLKKRKEKKQQQTFPMENFKHSQNHKDNHNVMNPYVYSVTTVTNIWPILFLLYFPIPGLF